MPTLYFITHPDVLIDPKVPVPEWPLSRPWAAGLRSLWCSTERKTRDGATRPGQRRVPTGQLLRPNLRIPRVTSKEEQASVLAAITTRRSVRGFRPTAVPQAIVETILTASDRAPSATNTQPWRAYVLTGEARTRLSAAIMAERASGAAEPAPEYAYYSSTMPEPYLSRRRTVGWQLYGLLGITKGDRSGARGWHDQNFTFFGAPVGMIFTVDRRLGLGAYLDLGMFMQNIMTAARGFGLDTCPQAAFAGYHATIRRELSLPEEEMVMCGLALGWVDDDAPANTLVAERVALADFAVFKE